MSSLTACGEKSPTTWPFGEFLANRLIESADTGPLCWLQFGDIGTARNTVLENIANAKGPSFLYCSHSGLGPESTRFLALRLADEADVIRAHSDFLQRMALLKATFVTTIVGSMANNPMHETTRPISAYPRAAAPFHGFTCDRDCTNPLYVEHSMGAEPKSYPLADFYEPVEYNWSDAAYEIDRALKIFSENTYADS